jgi:G3E family GTPase
MDSVSQQDIESAKRVFAAINKDKSVLKTLKKDSDFDGLFELLRTKRHRVNAEKREHKRQKKIIIWGFP